MRRFVQDYFTPLQVERGIRRRRRAGQPLSFEAVRTGSRDGCTLISAAIKFFGSWGQAVTAAGCSYERVKAAVRPGAYPTKTDLIAGMRQRRQRGWPMNIRSLQRGKRKDLSMTYAATRFYGGWPQALAAAGMSYRKAAGHIRKYIDRREVRAAIVRRMRRRLPVNASAVYLGPEPDVPLYTAGKAFFGSWQKALRAAGVPKSERGRAGLEGPPGAGESVQRSGRHGRSAKEEAMSRPTVRFLTMTGVTWHLYVVRTVGGCLYAGIATNVRRRYREHAAGGPKAARFLRANPPRELVFKRRIGSRSLALKVEYRFKQLSKRDKEAIVRTGTLRFDRTSGEIRR